ncbi:MAG: hypothetical protein K8H88_18185 [Sandaracinaceae bacterium]|nr:hypothetical protein [Sandaracinaceae bacterium]
MGLLEEVRHALPAIQGGDELRVRSQRGAGALGWDPADAREAAAAECVILEGRDCFAALCRLGGEVRYLTGLAGEDEDSREWPFGAESTLDAALAVAVPQAAAPYDPPPEK